METVICEYCGKELPKSEAVYIESAEIYLCPDCAEEQTVVCEHCGERITLDDAHEGLGGYLCDICYDDLFG